jgi:nicotinamidase/pyrazinamidase
MSGEAAFAHDARVALLLVDIQNDFMPGGSLGVPGGDVVVPIANELAKVFASQDRLVVASRDWHPEKTVHFKAFGGQWPPHCVIGSPGAEFHPDLRLPGAAVLVSKGMNPDVDAYSAFDGASADGRPLADLLESARVQTLCVAGLATDYCVRWTVDEALRRRLRTLVVLDAVRGVDVNPGDSERNLQAMAAAGAVLTSAAEITWQLRVDVG